MEIISITNQHKSNISNKPFLKNKINKENKLKECLFNSAATKNSNKSVTENNPVEFNCNCIGKYSYKNTEAITIINNNTHYNNLCHSTSTTRTNIFTTHSIRRKFKRQSYDSCTRNSK